MVLLDKLWITCFLFCIFHIFYSWSYFIFIQKQQQYSLFFKRSYTQDTQKNYLFKYYWKAQKNIHQAYTYFSNSILINSHKNSVALSIMMPNFAEEETEAQKGYLPKWQFWDLNLKILVPRPVLFPLNHAAAHKRAFSHYLLVLTKR